MEPSHGAVREDAAVLPTVTCFPGWSFQKRRSGSPLPDTLQSASRCHARTTWPRRPCQAWSGAPTPLSSPQSFSQPFQLFSSLTASGHLLPFPLRESPPRSSPQSCAFSAFRALDAQDTGPRGTRGPTERCMAVRTQFGAGGSSAPRGEQYPVLFFVLTQHPANLVNK